MIVNSFFYFHMPWLMMLDFAGNATLLYYLSEEGQEGRNAYVEKRKPNFKKFGRMP